MAEVVRQSHSWYPPGVDSPRTDPTYAKRIMDALREHQGESVHLEAVVGGDAWTIYEIIMKLRRLGWVIEGQRGVAGYTYVDQVPPEGWLRLAPSRRSKKRSPRCRPGKSAPMAGQIEMGT